MIYDITMLWVILEFRPFVLGSTACVGQYSGSDMDSNQNAQLQIPARVLKFWI